MTNHIAAAAESLRTLASLSNTSNAGEPGYWREIALAAEELAGTTSTANVGEPGYMLRTAVALEGLESTDPAGKSLLKRIVDAMEAGNGVVNAGSLEFRLELAAASYAGGGGGGGPTAIVVADFKNGVYSIGGVSKTLEETWVEDLANWGIWNTARVVNGTGLIAEANGGPVLSSSASMAIFPGFVCVVNGVVTSGADWFADITDFPGYTLETIFQVKPAEGVAAYQGSDPHTWLPVSLGAFKAAFLLDGTSLASSVNGSSNQTTTRTVNSDNAFAIGFNVEAGSAIEKIEFFSLSDYDAADLPGLSA